MAQLDKLDCVVPVDYISENKAMDIVNFTGAEYMKSNVDFSWKGLPDIYVIFGSHEVLLAELDEAKQKAASEKCCDESLYRRGNDAHMGSSGLSA